MSSYVQLYQLQNSMKNATVKTVSAHNSKIHSVAWNVDGRRLASGSTDKTVAVFTFENKEKLVSKNKPLNSKFNSNNTYLSKSQKRIHLKDTMAWWISSVGIRVTRIYL